MASKAIPSPSQVTGKQPGQRGIHLKQGMPILYGIARVFTDMDDVFGLAVFLLEGYGRGGRVYVQSLMKDPNSRIKPYAAAHDVLETWCVKKPEEAFGDKLLQVLQMKHVNPQAAKDFKHELLTGDSDSDNECDETSSAADDVFWPASEQTYVRSNDEESSSSSFDRRRQTQLPDLEDVSRVMEPRRKRSRNEDLPLSLPARKSKTHEAVAIVTIPRRFGEVAIFLDETVMEQNESLVPFLEEKVRFALMKPVEILRIEEVKPGERVKASSTGRQPLCVVCCNFAGDFDSYEPGEIDNFEQNIRRRMSKLLKIPLEAIEVYLVAEGNSIQVILGMPFNSAQHLVQLWKADKEEVRRAFLHQGDNGRPVYILSLSTKAGSKAWRITPATLSSWEKARRPSPRDVGEEVMLSDLPAYQTLPSQLTSGTRVSAGSAAGVIATAETVTAAMSTPWLHPRGAEPIVVSTSCRKVHICVEMALADHRNLILPVFRDILQDSERHSEVCHFSKAAEILDDDNVLALCNMNEDMPLNMDLKEYASERFFKRLIDLYQWMSLETEVAEQVHSYLLGIEQVGRSHKEKPLSFTVVMKRKMLQLLLCVPKEVLVAQTALLQVGYVLGRISWPLAHYGVNVSLHDVVAYRLPTFRKALFKDVDISDVSAVNIAVVGPPNGGKTLLIATLKQFLQDEAARLNLDFSKASVNFLEVPSLVDFGEFERTEFQYILDGQLPCDSYVRPADREISTLRRLVTEDRRAPLRNRVHAVIFMIDTRMLQNTMDRSSSRWAYFRAFAKFRGIDLVGVATHHYDVPVEEIEDVEDCFYLVGTPQGHGFFVDNLTPGEQLLSDGTRQTVVDILATTLSTAELCILRQRQHELTIARLGNSQGRLKPDTPLLVAAEQLRRLFFFPRRTIKDLLYFLASLSINNLGELRTNAHRVTQQCRLAATSLQVPLQQLCITCKC